MLTLHFLQPSSQASPLAFEMQREVLGTFGKLPIKFDSSMNSTAYFAKWNLFSFKYERILEVLWSTAACRLPLVVNTMLSPNYHYWIKVSRTPQNFRMIILRCPCICEEWNFFTSSIIPCLKSFKSPLTLFYSRLLGRNSTFVTLEEKLRPPPNFTETYKWRWRHIEEFEGFLNILQPRTCKAKKRKWLYVSQ